MTSKHMHTYTALICKYTPFLNHQNKKQKAEEIELSVLHDEEFKIFALEYNTSNTEPNNELDHYVNTLQQHNEDFDPGINDAFLYNLDPTFYAMQMQNPDVLTHETQENLLKHNDQKSKA
jgi:hypothetical protein